MEGERYAASLRGFRPERAFAGAQDAGSAIALALDGARGELSVAGDGCVRLRIGQDELPALPEAGVERAEWRPIGVDLRESPTGGFSLGAAGLHMQVYVEAKPFGLRVDDRRGAAIAELGGLRCEPGGAVVIALTLAPRDSVHGLADAAPALDLRGRSVRLCLGDTQRRHSGGGARFAIPFLLVHRTDPIGAGSCGVLVDGFGAYRFDAGAARADALEITAEIGGLDLLIVPGPSPRDVVRRLTARIGRAPLPPRWALGHHVALRANSARAVSRALRRHDAAQRPAALHLEPRGGRSESAFAFPVRRFPDAKGLLRELAEQGVRAVIRIPPGIAVDPADPVYRDGLARNVFLQGSDGRQYAARARPHVALPDFNRPEVRRWWAEQHAPLLDAGAAGFWNDANAAPARARDAGQLLSADPADPRARIPFEAVRHLYAQQQCRATRDALEARDPARRPFVLSAGGGAGVACYAAAAAAPGPGGWTDLATVLHRLLSLSLCGAAFCGADIGGDAGRCAPELFARWMQLGALQPFARSRAPARLPRRVAPIVRDALALRARLLPYLESLLRIAEQHGTPVWRALFFEFPDDPEAPAIDNQLMLGPALLVAPVLCAGARERSVYLPAGDWLAWHDDALYRGPRRIRVGAPLERLPLFARAGAVLPTAAAPEAILLEVFPGADRRFEWVEDDGRTTRYREGELARTAIRLWSRAGGRLRLELGRREGPYPIAPRRLGIRIHACPRADEVLLDGTPLPEGDATPGWRIEDGRLLVSLPDSGRGAAIEVVPAP